MESAIKHVPWKILLIEDDEEDYLLAKAMLCSKSQGRYVLDWASTYNAGVEALQREPYDAVLLDYFLGAQDGLAFLKEVDARNCPYPFILLSGRGSAEMDLDVFEAGATFSITKNELNSSFLERTIRYAIEQHSLEEKLKQSEAQLRESEEKFRVALKNSPMLVYTTDKDLRYTWIYNPAFGHEQADLIGKTDEEVNRSEDVSELTTLKRSVLESGAGKRQEISIQYQGQLYFYDVTVEPLRDDNGLVTGLTVAAIDITGKKQLEQARLADQIKIELQRRLMEQREQERQQIARDIHDGPIQTLVSTIFNIQYAKESINDLPLQVELNQIGLSVKNAVQELREVVNELRPPSLLRFGLSKAIKVHAIELQEKHSDLTLILELENDSTELLQNTLSEQVSLTLFRIYQEAMNNVFRHAEAQRALVRLTLNEEHVTLEVIDNGKGFSFEPDLSSLTAKGHYGIAGMNERAQAVNGELQIQSQPGKGTSVRVLVPMKQPA